jgi:hypothetical protein
MSKGNNVGPVRKSVNRTDVQVVSGVASDDAGNEGPSAEQSAREGSQLVGSLGVVLILSGNQLVGLIFGFEVIGLARELCVANEAAVVDSSGKVQGGVRLQRVTNRDDGELLWSASYFVGYQGVSKTPNSRCAILVGFGVGEFGVFSHPGGI